MANYFSTSQKIALANNIVSEFCNNVSHHAPMLDEIREMEQRYISSNGRSWDLSDFCIRISEIPVKYFKLMLTMRWLDFDTEEPISSLIGFYKSVYHGKQGFTKIEHFITVEAYIDLLFIELELTKMYE
ncbi:MAG: hypothetical protein K0R14_1956 [Burkholderiales bacterium]|jgi:hypothetical protein|nr:hypothetical protein [Burkholderiales bacterium]